MPNTVNREGVNLTLLGYSSKVEYFGGNAIAFRQTQTFNYEYTTTDLANWANGLSPLIASGISGQIANFAGDVTIRGLDIPAAYEGLEEQIRTAIYKISVEVRQSIGSGDSNYYAGLTNVTQIGYAALDTFNENFSFDNTDEAQKFDHSINFVLRTGDMSFAQTLASGIMQTSEPATLGVSVLSGYLGTYADNNSTNYYTESYDSFKNAYTFKKTKTLYKNEAAGYTFDTNTHYDFNDGISTITDEIKVKGVQSFSQAQAGLMTLIGTSPTRCAAVYTAYEGFSNLGGGGTMLTTPLKQVLKYNQQALTADGSLTYTDNPLYTSGYKLEEVLNLSQDLNGIVKVSDEYNVTLLQKVTANMIDTNTTLALVSADTSSISTSFYTGFGYKRSLYPTMETTKMSLRKRVSSAIYEYSDDPRYNITLTNLSGQSITFQNVDIKINDTAPKDDLTEFKVINKSETIVNYAYQQQPGNKIATLTAIRTRPQNNQLTNFNVPVTEVQCLYTHALNLISQTFQNLNGLNYYLSNLVFSINSENKLELTATVSYTKKKYV